MTNKILDLLAPSAVCLGLSASTAREVVTILGNRLFEAGYVQASYVEAALQREAQMPTGLALEGKYNAALPHTDIEHVIKPALALATLVEPVIFQNMVDPEESVSVRLVILMALEEAKSQVEMLQAIAGVLQSPSTIERIIAAGNYQDVVTALSNPEM